ncbi:MAG TPA: fasciclin domain-containing protein [Pyrinomonadaceae bacterium]|nr:fasciclin domain-containing protein [Pyrinomonadaceae bacterium]
MKKLILGFAAALVLVPVMASAQTMMKKDIVDTAASTGMFNTLVAALKAAGWDDELKGEGPFTVFAPTDEAFAKLPAGTVEKLLMPENKEMLARILQYHVVSGNAKASDVVKMKAWKTIEGQDIWVKSKDGKVWINNASVVKADVGAANGTIHVIDTVLMPK